MTSLFKRILLTCILGSFFLSGSASVFAEQIFSPTGSRTELDLQNGKRTGQNKESYANDSYISQVEGSFSSGFGNTFNYFRGSATGERGAFALLVNIARDAKNIFIFVAVIYLVISVLRILLSGGGEEDIKAWKNTVLWTTIGIVVMQSAFVFVDTLYNKNITGFTAMLFMDRLIYPFVNLLGMLASFAFLAMAIFAFYRIVTSAGDEEGVKSGKRTIVYALIGFLIMYLPGKLVQSIYGKASCDTPIIFSVCKIEDPNLGGFIGVFTSIINYVNGFLALVIVVLILYSGFLVLTSAGDEEKIKKAKNILKYIVIGVIILVSSYILFNLFVLKG